MPRMGGPDLVDKLRQKREGFAVIFMSGYTDAAALENAKIGSSAILLSKPFSTESLARKISEVQQRQSTQTARAWQRGTLDSSHALAGPRRVVNTAKIPR